MCGAEAQLKGREAFDADHVNSSRHVSSASDFDWQLRLRLRCCSGVQWKGFIVRRRRRDIFEHISSAKMSCAYVLWVLVRSYKCAYDYWFGLCVVHHAVYWLAGMIA